MTLKKIKAGIINFTNCLPFNHAFEKISSAEIEIIKSGPAEINNLMRTGKIHIAPISSIEYLRNQDKYVLIEEACISSNNECGSVLLFSKYDIKELQEKKIALPADSETSSAMLKIILKKFNINTEKIEFLMHNYEGFPEELLKSNFDAVLFIGDNALISRHNLEIDTMCFDIGKLWKNMTGYPAVFGTWAASRSWAENNPEEFYNIRYIINKAIETGLGIYFNEIISSAKKKLKIKKEIIEDYLKNKLNYKFNEEHKKSLVYFEQEINLVNKKEQCI